MTDITSLSFEKAPGELESIVRKLEEGNLSLEASLSAYERGSALRRHCEQKLKAAQLKIEEVITSGDSITTQPFEEPS